MIAYDFDGIFVEDMKENGMLRWFFRFICPQKYYHYNLTRVKKNNINKNIKCDCIITGRSISEKKITVNQLSLSVPIYHNINRSFRKRISKRHAFVETILFKAETINKLKIDIYYESSKNQVKWLKKLCLNTKILLYE